MTSIGTHELESVSTPFFAQLKNVANSDKDRRAETHTVGIKWLLCASEINDKLK
jgi:hypothetical protein